MLHVIIAAIWNAIISASQTNHWDEHQTQITPENKDELMCLKAQRRQEYRERIPIERKFGPGKYGYRLNNIRTKRVDAFVAWINSILVMNLFILVRFFYLSEKSCCQNSILDGKKDHSQKNWIYSPGCNVIGTSIFSPLRNTVILIVSPTL